MELIKQIICIPQANIFDFLCRSESLGQVFLFTITWLYTALQGTDPQKWSEKWLVYDNMCQLLRLKAARNKLPLPKPYDEMWNYINKAIDAFHLGNHKSDECKERLNPKRIGDMHPHLKDTKNTSAAEQTFSWLGRFKKILSAMNKTHHLFYLHRLVVRRNSYTARCYKAGRKPLLPSVKNSTNQ